MDKDLALEEELGKSCLALDNSQDLEVGKHCL